MLEHEFDFDIILMSTDSLEFYIFGPFNGNPHFVRHKDT